MGFSAAFAAALGFVWVDIVKPQQLAYSIINGQPLSMIAAAFTVGLFALTDKKSPPKFGTILVLIAMFALWITLTTSMSAFPERAWQKWDWASKVMIFALIFPFIFRSRVQLEAFILIFIFSASTIFFSAGAKTMLGGGGYGVLAIMGSSNTGLSESSTLALVCVMLIPLMVYVMRHTLIFPKNKYTYALFAGLIVMALATVVGTAARTGLITVALLGGMFILRSRKKALWAACLAVAAIVVMNIDLSNTPWGARMSTIESFDEDSSALGRIAVWQWTVEFIGSHPMGGGFDAYMHNRISTVLGDGTIVYHPDWKLGGKAFHSIYFEVLGEQGIPGFLMYFLAISISLLKLRALKKRWREHAGMGWLVALADALTMSIIVFLAGGAFVGIAYQPFIFYMMSMTVAIDQYSARVERAQLKEHKAKGRVAA